MDELQIPSKVPTNTISQRVKRVVARPPTEVCAGAVAAAPARGALGPANDKRSCASSVEDALRAIVQAPLLEGETVALGFARKEQELRAAQEAGAADRVVQVEVVGRVR